MCIAQLLPRKPRIQRQQHRADDGIEARPARHEAPVHRIMADNEHPDRKPALHRRHAKRERPVRPAEFEHEHGIGVNGQPAPRNRHRQRKTDGALLRVGRKGDTGVHRKGNTQMVAMWLRIEPAGAVAIAFALWSQQNACALWQRVGWWREPAIALEIRNLTP
jgi:hypothetical protein